MSAVCRAQAGLRKDGTTFPVRVSLTPVATAAGQFALAVIRDITGAAHPLDRLAKRGGGPDGVPGGAYRQAVTVWAESFGLVVAVSGNGPMAPGREAFGTACSATGNAG